MNRESELDLVRRLRDGDRDAFDIVYSHFNARLFTFLARLSRSRPRAEDLLEETWLRLVTHARTLDAETRLGAWLFTVARNLHVSSCRSRLLEDVYVRGGLGLWPVVSPASPFEETAASELERRIESALANLPAAYREVLLLVAVEGMAQADVAEVCGISAAALRQRLKRARDLLEQRLESAASSKAALREVIP
jgi:RNA polymerase sigma-70 factor (ECF subfamily)